MKSLIVWLLFVANLSFAQSDSIKIPPERTNANTAKRYVKVERVATYPGGDTAFNYFLVGNIKKIADSASAAGIKKRIYTVMLTFMVNVDGKVKAVSAETRPKQSFIENSCNAMIETSPVWITAIHNGQPIKALRRVKLTIEVE